MRHRDKDNGQEERGRRREDHKAGRANSRKKGTMRGFEVSTDLLPKGFPRISGEVDFPRDEFGESFELF